MKFDLKKPCKDCPFIPGSCTNTTLSKRRITSIVTDIENDMSFSCHKTTDKPSSQHQHCAGAMIFLERENKPNQMMRFAERLGFYDHTKLEMDTKIINKEDVKPRVRQ